MKRGRDIHQAYAERITAEKLAQHNVGGCAWCPDFKPVGTVAETSALSLEHRRKHHPETLLKKKHTRRVVPMRTLLSGKTLDDNIAAARVEGAATWDGAA